MKSKKKSLFAALLCTIFVLMLTTTVSAANIKISKSKTQLTVGASTTLKMTGTSKKVTWKSNNKSIATVSSSGKVTGKKTGKAVITATVNKKKYTCTVTVVNPVKLNKTTIGLNLNASYQLKVLNTTKKVTWKSSNKSVATVSSSGKVTAKKTGKAVITATVNKKKYTCTVTVVNPVKLNKTSIELNLNASYQLKVLNTTKKVTWKSSNKSVATVSSSGKVTAKKTGKAVITATVNKKTYKCNITVSKAQVTTSTTYYIGTSDKIQLSAPGLTGKITWTSNNPNVVTVSNTGVISSPLSGSCVESAIVTASTKTKKHYFYIHVDGSYLSKSEILLFEGNTARITMKYGYLYDKYTLKNGNTSVAKDEILTYTNSLAFEVTGKKAGTTTITIVGDNKRTYQLKVTVVKKNNEMQPRSKKVVSILENKYHLVPEITSDVKQYILNPEAATWEQANITLTTDNEYVGIMLPPSGTGSESWLSIVKEVIQIMAPKNGAVLYSNLISDPYVSSTKILEGMNVTALSYGDRYLWFESGSLIN